MATFHHVTDLLVIAMVVIGEKLPNNYIGNLWSKHRPSLRRELIHVAFVTQDSSLGPAKCGTSGPMPFLTA